MTDLNWPAVSAFLIGLLLGWGTAAAFVYKIAKKTGHVK